jgi:hypothetical protein
MTDSSPALPADGPQPAPHPELLRIGNAEREQVVQRVHDAFAEGRLDAEELQQRLDGVYRAKTLADLTPLVADLPARSGPASRSEPRLARPAMPIQLPRAVVRHRVPTALRVLWIIWLTAVAVNVAVWLVVCITTGDLIYGWPLWVALPAGTALLVLSIVLRQDLSDPDEG